MKKYGIFEFNSKASRSISCLDFFIMNPSDILGYSINEMLSYEDLALHFFFRFHIEFFKKSLTKIN